MKKTDDPHIFRLDRRLFLRGLGGTALALPLLPSLLTSSEAAAQAAARSKCFVHFRTPHGALFGANMWPADDTLTERVSYADHEIRRGALKAAVSGTDAAISRVLTARSSALSPALVAKINILRGLDYPLYMGHNLSLIHI